MEEMRQSNSRNEVQGVVGCWLDGSSNLTKQPVGTTMCMECN